jgi:hypothetical protein
MLHKTLDGLFGAKMCMLFGIDNIVSLCRSCPLKVILKIILRRGMD